MPTTILVTGGAGFIGSCFIRHALDALKGTKIVCMDKITYASSVHTIEDLFAHPRFFFEKEDISDYEAVDRIFKKYTPDMVVNFAAETHVDRSINDPGVFLRTNVLGVQALLDACLSFNCPRFHQVSTDEVYGDLPLDKNVPPFTEISPLRPSSPYSASKASAELLALSYSRTFGLHVTITRASNNYGPFQHPEKLIPKMISNTLRDILLPVYGNGVNVRDWIHVSDHVRAVLCVCMNGKNGEIYNVGGGNEKNNLEIVHAILKTLHKPENLISFVPDRKGHDLRYSLDSGKIMNDLGFRPQISFEEGLRSTIEWYKENAEWTNLFL